MRGKGGRKGDRKLRGRGWEIRAYPMPGGDKRVRGGREIRLTQRENENEGRDVSTIDHRGSECNANHAPSLVPVPQRSQPHLPPATLPHPPPSSLPPLILLPVSHPSATNVPSVTQSRQDIDSDTHATYKQPGFTPVISISSKIPVDLGEESDLFIYTKFTN